jgi:predicted oxidoreductase
MIDVLHQADTGKRLTVLSRHSITALDSQNGVVTGASGSNDATGQELRFCAQAVVLAMGGINGSHAQTRANWVAGRPMPAIMLNGAHPFADGKLHHLAAGLGGQITHAGEMWNYAAGFPHPHPHFEGHGLSAIPCKSALWLDHTGRRIGPQPLVTGFDTHALCQRVAALEKPTTWQLMNWRIAAKEFAISGAEYNQRIRDLQFPQFLKETLFGNHRLLKQIAAESKYFLVDGTLAGLTDKMNALAGTNDVLPGVLQQTADAFDANFMRGNTLVNDDQIRRIEHARHWGPDKLRTCKPAPLQMRGAGPFIAIQMQLITRKSLGGLQTDLQSRVLDAAGQPMPGLYCVGEAAGFGGGGASGKRSLEGTFLPGCILTARSAARSINAGRGL